MRKSLNNISIATCVTIIGFAAFSATAQASTPETPSLSASGVSSTGATLLGVVNPGAAEPKEGGTYQFVYRATGTGECKGSGETLVPETPGFTAGLEHEELFPEPVGGLSPGTEYVACLIVTEPGTTEPAVSTPATFKTRMSLEQPTTDSPTEVDSGTAVLEGTLNPNAPAEEGESYNFVYQEESPECRGEAEVSVPEAPIPAGIEEDQHVSSEATGLLPRTSYTYCVLVTTEFGESAQGEPVTFTTPVGVPAVSGSSVTGLGSTEATISATVDPGGAATTVHIDGPGIVETTKTLPNSKVGVLIQQRLLGLTPGTTYVVRIAGVNEKGRGESEVTFSTPSIPPREEVGSHCGNKGYVGFSPSLPDCRAAELVSPASEVGEVYDPGGGVEGHEEDITTLRPFRAAAGGARVAYVGDPGLAGGDGSTAKNHGNEYLASHGDAGWSAVNITPPVGEGENPTFQREYKYFSPDLSAGIVLAERPLLAVAPHPQVPNNCSALYGVDSTVTPALYSGLFTETLSPESCGPTIKGEGQGTDSNLFFAGETPNHTIKLFDSKAALVTPAVQPAERGGNIYVSMGGALKVINVLPSGIVEPSAVAGAPSELSANGPDLSNVLAPTGNRVIWSSVAPGESNSGRTASFPTALYARDEVLSGGAHTIELDEATSGATGASGAGRFWTSADAGNKVFFTDCHRLTDDATAHEEGECHHLSSSESLVQTGSDLYEYDFSRSPGQRLVDLTVDHDGSDSDGADVQGVIGASENGDTVYFVAGGTLGAAPNSQGAVPHPGSCETPPEGSRTEHEGHVPAGFGCNLFELHFNGVAWEAPIFVATLAVSDDLVNDTTQNDPEQSFGEISGDWNPRLGSRTAEVTPNGEAVVFSSTQDLAGYDVARAGAAPSTNAQGANEIFIFRRASGGLTCTSCDPRNLPPNIEDMQSSFETYVPVSSSDTFMRRWVNSSGTEVFFDSSQPLVDKDLNGTQDVYEWAAEGTPSCPLATSDYGGCIFLLTSGESEAFSFLVDSDESGANVFAVHRGPLYGVGPVGTKSELYDLRASGGTPPTAGQGCDSVATCPASPVPAPSPSVPGSSVITGSENYSPASAPKVPPVKQTPAQVRAAKLRKALSACKRTHRRSRQRRLSCERIAKHHFGAKTAARSKTAGSPR